VKTNVTFRLLSFLKKLAYFWAYTCGGFLTIIGAIIKNKPCAIFTDVVLSFTLSICYWSHADPLLLAGLMVLAVATMGGDARCWRRRRRRDLPPFSGGIPIPLLLQKRRDSSPFSGGIPIPLVLLRRRDLLPFSPSEEEGSPSILWWDPHPFSPSEEEGFSSL
jgi:hypothetical protein